MSLTAAFLGNDVKILVCRVCLNVLHQSDREMSHLDRPLLIKCLGLNVTIRHMLNTVRSTQIYVDSSLPQNICGSCTDCVLLAFMFWLKCEKSEKHWTNLIDRLYKSVNSIEVNFNESKTNGYSACLFTESKLESFTLPINIENRKDICDYLNCNASIKMFEFNHEISDEFIPDCDHNIKRKKKKKYKTKNNENYTCAHCSVTFMQKTYLMRHLKKKHHVFQKVECNECGKKFDNISLLRRHVFSHKTLDVYKCSMCQKVFNLGSELENHVITEHHEKNIKCSECSDHFHSEKDLKKHCIAIHSYSGHKFVCKECGKDFQSFVGLSKHEERHRGVICDKCGRNFPFPYKLRLHAERCEKHGDRIKCKFCTLTFNKRMEAIQHAKEIHKRDEYKCESCNKLFTSQARLKCHLERHVGVVCEQCGKHFKYQSQLKTHRKVCLKVSKKPGNPRPKLQTSEAPQFICDHCGKEFHLKESLKAHIKGQHLFHKQHKCYICEKRFNYVGGLNTHMIVHTRERKEQCNMCGKYFVTKPALVYHMRLHTGEKPFKCEHCEENFISASRRMAHIRKKHWGRTVECSICASKFFTAYAMRKHMSRHFNPSSKLYCNKINDVCKEC